MDESPPVKIFVIDDDLSFLSWIAHTLRSSGFEVETANQGQKALTQIEETQPDLILLDVMMPGFDGFEVCRHLKADKATKDIPVIFMTALSDTENKIKGFDIGAVDYIDKPIQYKEVVARIKNHVAARALQKELLQQNKELREENVRRRRVQDALKESRERYRFLADNSTDLISRQTPNGIYIYVSPACQTLLGYKIEEMAGQQADSFVHPDDLVEIEREAESAPNDRLFATLTYRVRHKDGHYVWLETTNKYVRDAERGDLLEITAVSRDVTERKEAEAALQKAHDELEQRVEERTAEIKAYSEELQRKNEALSRLDKLKDEFLANTSHELRTPLNGIIGIAESMVDGVTGSLTPQQVYNLSMIVMSGQRLTNLVNDILDFSKLKHQELILSLKPIDMQAITEVVLILSQPLIGSKPVNLISNIDRGLPQVRADENRAQQIMHNLISNAVKFTETGSVTVSAVAENDRLLITVADTGIGIPADKIESVFESFEQVDASITRTYGGTGLGLPITKKLVELHGGTIQLESTLGQGTTVTFSLPIFTETEKAKVKISHPEMNGIGGKKEEIKPLEEFIPPNVEWKPGNIEPLPSVPQQELNENSDFTILVVDDELINVQVLTNYLSMQNYGIAHAFDGMEAMEAFEEVDPDLILLDVMMPKMSGFEVCRKIRQLRPAHELPIVLVTAKNQISDLVAGFEAGANDYLTKPFDKSELLTRTKTHLRLAKINTAYGRFVPQEFLQFLDKESIIDVNLGDQVQREMTILFSDIRSFTSLSEDMTPQENFNFLNSYLNRVSPIIRQHGGFIDKYIGDAVMALFPRSVEDSVRSAVAMQQEVVHYNQLRSKVGYRSIEVGIGIHTGSLMLGTIGEERRMEGTVISDAVNLAARLEGLTKLYGASIVISGPTIFELGEQSKQFDFRFLGRVQVKGKKDSVAVFEVLNGCDKKTIDLKLKTLSDFEQGLLNYSNQEFRAAIEYFKRVLKVNPDDKASYHYSEQAQHFLTHGTPPDWDGVETLKNK